jgi:CRISPR-associated protein (TIGR03984 family)
LATPDLFSVNELGECLSKAMPLAGVPALALIQGYPHTRLLDAAMVLQSIQPNRWEDFFDLRVFGPEGEWHAWNLGDGKWGIRWWKASAQDKKLQIDRKFPLWGNEAVANPVKREEGWALLREGNGAEVWMPEAIADRPPGAGNVVAILNAVELVGFDPCTGLAGIVDCALRSIEPNPHPKGGVR